MFPRDIVFLRNINVNTVHKGDDDDDNNNNSNNTLLKLLINKVLSQKPSSKKQLGHKHTRRITAQYKVMKGKEQRHINLK